MEKKGGNGDPTFEDLLAEAEGLAEKMEEGGLSLDESIAAYEKGVENLKKCAALLKTAEDRVKTLVERNGEFSLEDFHPPGDAGSAGGDDDME